MWCTPAAAGSGYRTTGVVDDGDAMVLVGVGQECDEVVAEGHARLEQGGVPVDQRVEVGSLEHDVGELLRGDPLRGRREHPGLDSHCALRTIRSVGAPDGSDRETPSRA